MYRRIMHAAYFVSWSELVTYLLAGAFFRADVQGGPLTKYRVRCSAPVVWSAWNRSCGTYTSARGGTLRVQRRTEPRHVHLLVNIRPLRPSPARSAAQRRALPLLRPRVPRPAPRHWPSSCGHSRTLPDRSWRAHFCPVPVHRAAEPMGLTTAEVRPLSPPA